jgi:hypothetical protein
MANYLSMVKLLLRHLINILYQLFNIYTLITVMLTLISHENPICYLSSTFNQSFPTIKLKSVSSKEIEDIMKSLQIKNSYGYDGISTKN